MQTNIYAQKENGDLRLLAEIEGLNDPALAVDALLDEMPRLKQREFIVIDLDNVMVVEAGDEVVQPRRQITIRSSNGTSAVGESEAEDEEQQEEDGEDEAEAEEQPEEEAPKPTPRRGRARGSSAPAKRRSPGRPRGSKNKTAGKKGGSPFKANPASAE